MPYYTNGNAMQTAIIALILLAGMSSFSCDVVSFVIHCFLFPAILQALHQSAFLSQQFVQLLLLSISQYISQTAYNLGKAILLNKLLDICAAFD